MSWFKIKKQKVTHAYHADLKKPEFSLSCYCFSSFSYTNPPPLYKIKKMVTTSLARQNFQEVTENAVNQQIQMHQMAQHTYLAASAYFNHCEAALPVRKTIVIFRDTKLNLTIRALLNSSMNELNMKARQLNI